MILRSFFFATVLGMAMVAGAVSSVAAPKEVSEATLHKIKQMAFDALPQKFIVSKDKAIDIDKSDPSKIIVPDEDARAIIRAAYLTAHAHRCSQPELVVANRDAILQSEKNKNKWSFGQLQYINILHLYTVELLVGKVEVTDADAKLKTEQAGKVLVPEGSHKTCSDDEKKEVQIAIETAFTAAFKDTPEFKKKGDQPAAR